MRPPMAIAKVTAGFTCPPEILAEINTAEASAKALATATTARLDGSDASLGINLPVHNKYT